MTTFVLFTRSMIQRFGESADKISLEKHGVLYIKLPVKS